MNCSMEDYLNIVTPYLHPNLVSCAARSRIQALAQILPPFSYAGLECRLGADQSRVDLQVQLPCLVLELPETLLAHPLWQFVQELGCEWVEPTSLLHRTVRNMVLDFDVAELDGHAWRAQVPLPCLFLGFSPYVGEAERLVQLAMKLSNNVMPPRLESNLRLCAEALPANARISHLGAMLPRMATGVRVNVCGMTAQHKFPGSLVKPYSSWSVYSRAPRCSPRRSTTAPFRNRQMPRSPKTLSNSVTRGGVTR